MGEHDLLKTLATYEVLVFFPQVLETFCRLAAEAKMLECKLLTTPKMLGFASETCYNLSGEALLNELKERRDKALALFLTLLEK